MSTPDYMVFPLYGYDVAGEPSGPVDPGAPMGPSALEVNGQPAGYNLPADYTGPLLVGSPGGEAPVVLTDQAAIDEYRHDAQTRALQGIAAVAALPLAPYLSVTAVPGSGSGSPLQLYQVDPQVNFPPGEGSRIYVPGTEPPPSGGNRLPVPYEPIPPSAGAVVPGIFPIIGGIIGALWEGWPNALDPEAGPYDTRAPRAAPNDETPAEGPEFGPPSAQQLPGDYIDNPMPLPFPDFGGGPSQEPRPEDIDLGPVPDMGPPQGARQPAPTPAATQPGLPPWVWPVIGGIGAISLGRAGRSRSSQTLPSISVLPTPGFSVDDLTDLVAELRANELGGTSASTSFAPQTASGGVWDVAPGDDGCNCHKRSSKKRKCLARGQLSWRSGPKKGKPAGSRCIRFEN